MPVTVMALLPVFWILTLDSVAEAISLIVMNAGFLEVNPCWLLLALIGKFIADIMLCGENATAKIGRSNNGSNHSLIIKNRTDLTVLKD